MAGSMRDKQQQPGTGREEQIHEVPAPADPGPADEPRRKDRPRGHRPPRDRRWSTAPRED
ncbi:hypothetical protein [Streptomyces sp. NPDC047718]|uniref:hypothetical protein n=1 Tax=Streptomyces sp. NPDC047718 TaxID=3155479 RepID=UPI00340FBA28